MSDLSGPSLSVRLQEVRRQSTNALKEIEWSGELLAWLELIPCHSREERKKLAHEVWMRKNSASEKWRSIQRLKTCNNGFGVNGRELCKRSWVLRQKSTHNHVGGFCSKKTRAFLCFHCFLHLCCKSIFSELGQILPHPTHDSAKSSPNVRISCPTQYRLHRCSQLVFFYHS